MAPHSSTLAWKIPWTEEPGRLQSMGSRRVGHNWATSLWLFTFLHWRRKWQPTPVFLPGEAQGRGSLVAAVCGVAQSRTRLRRLSSSSGSAGSVYGPFLYCFHFNRVPQHLKPDEWAIEPLQMARGEMSFKKESFEAPMGSQRIDLSAFDFCLSGWRVVHRHPKWLLNVSDSNINTHISVIHIKPKSIALPSKLSGF